MHPLTENDLIHNRLTHSLETSSVGRSLGTMVGSKIIANNNVENISEDEFGYVVQAACLAHDIGNPPFGHAGEEAISKWFESEFKDSDSVFCKVPIDKQIEFTKFEGNAQGFRILTQLENNKFVGGLQLTKAILGAFTKYPRPAYLSHTAQGKYVGAKKFGYFASEKKYFDDIASTLGLLNKGAEAEGFYARHPLAFLVEAADDICYNIVDLEDAVLNSDLRFEDVKNVLEPLSGKIKLIGTQVDKIAYLRAKAIGNVVTECSNLFIKKYDDIMSGKYSSSLTDDPDYKYHEGFAKIRVLANERIFTASRKTELEIAGHKIIDGLLSIFKDPIYDLHMCDWDSDKLKGNSKRLVRLAEMDFSTATDLYTGTHILTDYISGMTDRFASETYKKLSGIL